MPWILCEMPTVADQAESDCVRNKHHDDHNTHGHACHGGGDGKTQVHDALRHRPTSSIRRERSVKLVQLLNATRRRTTRTCTIPTDGQAKTKLVRERSASLEEIRTDNKQAFVDSMPKIKSSSTLVDGNVEELRRVGPKGDFAVKDVLPIESVVHHKEDSKNYTFIVHNQHLLARSVFVLPTVCGECGKFLFGKKNTGYKCAVCDATVHFKCAHMLGPCDDHGGARASSESPSLNCSDNSPSRRSIIRRFSRADKVHQRSRSLETEHQSQNHDANYSSKDFLAQLLEKSEETSAMSVDHPYVQPVTFWDHTQVKALLQKEYADLNVLFFENLYDGNRNSVGASMHQRRADRFEPAKHVDLAMVHYKEFVALRRVSNGILKTFFADDDFNQDNDEDDDDDNNEHLSK